MYGTLSYIHKDLFVPICTRLLNNNVEDIYTLRGGSRSTIAGGGGGAPIYIYIYICSGGSRNVWVGGWHIVSKGKALVQSTKCRAGGGYGRGVMIYSYSTWHINVVTIHMTYSYSTCHIVILHDILLLYMTYSYCGWHIVTLLDI